ncbi:MAG TPA: cobyrinate a,c-diamide synthase [Roseiflexaceae bacterium]|nr:cobyrinate a,c-diamide synthase [Roseiflexaceae bacterium]
MPDLPPRLIIAAPMSGSGKTTVTAGLIAALAGRGLRIAPFKVGPDYIDPSYHALAAGRPCHNLDAWMLPEGEVAALLAAQARDADLALIEGVMGLFDGVSGDDDTSSAAHVARLTGAPVLLVLDVRAMARTAAALVRGLRDFDPRVRLAGVVLNRAGSDRHAALVRAAVEAHAGLPVLGHLRRQEDLSLPERHLGLVPTAEPGRWSAWLAAARAAVEQTVDLDRILEVARSAQGQAPGTRSTKDTKDTNGQGHENRELNLQNAALNTLPGGELKTQNSKLKTPRIAVAQDEAFSFLYQDNLDLLRAAGAELVPFSPLRDAALPARVGALYLCGGFPELYAAALAANGAMRAAVRRAAEAGMPIYAECGGLMYLTETIVDQQGQTHPMAGVLPGRSVMTVRLTMGYRTVRALADSWLWRAGETARGHEFHYSTWETPPDLPPAYELLPGALQREQRPDGACYGSVFASYVHLLFRAVPGLAERLVAAAVGTEIREEAQRDQPTCHPEAHRKGV